MTQQAERFFEDGIVHDAAQAREICAMLDATHPRDCPRLKTIAAVGVYDAELGGSEHDSRRLTAIMAYLLRSGFPVDPDFEIDMVNFREGRDFLQESGQADLVFISFIIKEVKEGRTQTHVGTTHCEGGSLATQLDLAVAFGRVLSPYHTGEKWRERVAGAGAKMVVTYGGGFEIGTDVLCGGGTLVPLIPSSSLLVDDYAVWRGSGYDIETQAMLNLRHFYNSAAADLPLPWLGFCATPDYLGRVRPALGEGRTWLAQQALSTVRPVSRPVFQLKGDQKGLHGTQGSQRQGQGGDRPDHAMHP